jgi:hypothetical protein
MIYLRQKKINFQIFNVYSRFQTAMMQLELLKIRGIQFVWAFTIIFSGGQWIGCLYSYLRIQGIQGAKIQHPEKAALITLPFRRQ